MSNTKTDNRDKIALKFAEGVCGKIIRQAGYDSNGFPCLVLDDGSAIFVQADDECNRPGVPVHVSGEGENQKETGMWQVEYGF